MKASITAILNAPNIGEEVENEFINLYQLYHDSDPPPIQLLRSPSLIDIFINFLFIPTSSV